MTEPRNVLIASLEDLKGAQVSDDLRVIAFSKVFDMHAQATGLHAPRDTDTGVGGRDGRGGAAETPDVVGDKLEAIAVKASASRETVAEVYEVRDDGLDLIIPQGKLPAPTASATKEIALLLAGGRQAAGIDEWTSLDVVRDTCSDFKRMDSGNFAKTIRQMEDVFNVRKESDRKTVVRMSRPGWDAFGVLVRRLGGEA